MQKLIIAIVLLAGIVFIFIHLSEMQEIASTIRQGDIYFIVLAFMVQALWMLNVAASFRAIYRLLGLEEQIGRLYLMVAAANFINVIAPSAGVGGLTIYISEARRRGYSTARVTVAGGLLVLFDYLGFLAVLSLGLVVLFRRNNLNNTEIFASGVLFIIAIVLATMIILGMRSGQALGRLLAWMARQVNKFMWLFIHREYLSENRAHSFAIDAASGLQEVRQKPTSLLLPAALGLCSKVLLIVILYLVFMAFKVPFSIGALIAGFSIGYLFLIVSPTPAGIGVVEGALTLGLRSLNVSLGNATIITMVYRGITFWVPLLFGILSFRLLSRAQSVSEGID